MAGLSSGCGSGRLSRLWPNSPPGHARGRRPGATAGPRPGLPPAYPAESGLQGFDMPLGDAELAIEGRDFPSRVRRWIHARHPRRGRTSPGGGEGCRRWLRPPPARPGMPIPANGPGRRRGLPGGEGIQPPMQGGGAARAPQQVVFLLAQGLGGAQALGGLPVQSPGVQQQPPQARMESASQARAPCRKPRPSHRARAAPLSPGHQVGALAGAPGSRLRYRASADSVSREGGSPRVSRSWPR